MKKIFSILIFITAATVITGCAQKTVVKGTDLASKEVPPARQKQADSKQMDKQKPAQDMVTSREQPLDAQRVKKLQARIKDIHFDYDRYVIEKEAIPVLKDVSAILLTNKSLKVAIEGNCDERGTSEYKLALGDKRANAAKTFLSWLGVSPSRIETISYGKEKPVCTERSEECLARNRRDHFVLSEGNH